MSPIPTAEVSLQDSPVHCMHTYNHRLAATATATATTRVSYGHAGLQIVRGSNRASKQDLLGRVDSDQLLLRHVMANHGG
jgi:hypothetical protein